MSDEQRMRNEFEAALDEMFTGYDMAERDGHGYAEEQTQGLWEMAQLGYEARDAEVQALRKALAGLHADVCHLFGVSEPLPDGGLVAAIALTRLKEVGLGHADRLGRGLNAARTALAGQGENHD